MRADYEILLISFAIVLLAAGGIFLTQELAPELYNSITGKATTGTTVNITGGLTVNCSFPLREGMNLVSFYCAGDFVDIQVPMQDVENLIGVFSYSGGGWTAYNPNLPNYVVNDLTFLSRKRGYWVKMNSSEEFNYEGPYTLSTEISLSPGYRMVGYPQNTSESVNTTFDTINGSYSKVVGYDPVSDTFEIFVPSSGGSLTATEPGRGYWINVTSSDTWVVD